MQQKQPILFSEDILPSKLPRCIKAAWATKTGLVKPLYKQKHRLSEDNLSCPQLRKVDNQDFKPISQG